jgi:hypothetical protein
MFVLLGSIPPASGDAPISIRFADRAANRIHTVRSAETHAAPFKSCF